MLVSNPPSIMQAADAPPHKLRRISGLMKRIFHQRYLLLMLLPGFACLILFMYAPLYGVIIAFKDYNVGLGIFGSPWAGLKYFSEIINDQLFFNALRNTLFFSILGLVIGFPVPIIFALMLNELTGATLYKRVVQTISYLPHFLSWAFVANFLIVFFSDRGTLNPLLISLGVIQEPYGFLSNVRSFITIIITSSVWKSFGFSSIIYLAAMTSVPQEMYEAALMDGASRLQKIWYITLPSIKPTVVVLLILSISGMINSNFEQFYLLQNAFVIEYARVLDVYTYSIGFQLGRFSYATAVGLFKSIVSFVLLISANTLSRRVTGESIY
jgi:putative aldouronate transport system permease protein